jgi:hypothetical protein
LNNKRPVKFVGFSVFVVSTVLLLLAILSTTILSPVGSAFADSYSDGYDEGYNDAGRDLQGLNGHGYDESISHGDSEFRVGYVDGYRACWNEENYQPPRETYREPSGNGRDWLLTVNVVNVPFGKSSVFVYIKGQFGYENSQWVSTGPRTVANFNIPGSAVPVGYNFKVCAHANEVADYLLGLRCQSWIHKYDGNNVVTISLS